jgi:hypothetical protein
MPPKQERTNALIRTSSPDDVLEVNVAPRQAIRN